MRLKEREERGGQQKVHIENISDIRRSRWGMKVDELEEFTVEEELRRVKMPVWTLKCVTDTCDIEEV